MEDVRGAIPSPLLRNYSTKNQYRYMGESNNSFQEIEVQCMNANNPKYEDCEGDFIWSKGEQKFLQRLVDEGKINHDGSPVTFTQPRRCKSCRLKKRQEREARNQQ